MSKFSEPTPDWSLNPHSVHYLFEQHAANTPLAIAMRTPEGSWTYQQLDAYANRIANQLSGAGLQPGEMVGISALRSAKAMASLLGILKCGAAYVPLDARYPDERLRFMLADTAVRFLIADQDSADRLAGSIAAGCRILSLEETESFDTEFTSYRGDPSDLLCVLYTSGSTGTPKGVMIEHRGVTRLVIEPDYVTVRPDDTFIHLAPVSFDTSLFEIFGAWLNGAALVVLPHSVSNLSDIADAIEGFAVTNVWLTSGLFSAFVDECPRFLKNIRQLLVGGDVVSVTHAKKALAAMPDGVLLDCYGPTENTTFSTWHRVCSQDLRLSSIPIGRSIKGGGTWILDENRQPVQTGGEGEIYVTGLGLARGYWNRPELTRERFVDIEVQPGRTERAYKTGDLGRYNDNGDIVFIGRMDTQVKIRGFRIELGELELAMSVAQQVANAVAVAVPVGTSGEKTLRLCYVLRNGCEFTPAAAEQFLRERVPTYLLPSEYLEIPAVPLDPNGKVDRKALIALEREVSPQSEVTSGPSNSTEDELLCMLRDLLKSPHITAADDFFLIGGHSLLAARFFAQIEQKFGRRLPLALMLQVRTVRNLATVVATPGHSEAWSSIVPLRAQGAGNPVFLLHAIGGNVIGYRDLALRLPAHMPVYALQAEGLDGVAAMPETIEEMASNYIEKIRVVQPHGPYYLGGFSAGGVVAFEMARQLEIAGEQVGLIGLIDSNLNYSLVAVFRRHGLWRSLAQAAHVARWNMWYATQLGVRGFLHRKVRNLKLNLRIAWSGAQRLVRPSESQDTIKLSVEEAFIRAIRAYDPSRIRTAAVLFRTGDSALYDPNQEAAWRSAVDGSLDVITVPGTHETMLESPNIEVLAAEFGTALADARAKMGKSQGNCSSGSCARESMLRSDALHLDVAAFPSVS